MKVLLALLLTCAAHATEDFSEWANELADAEESPYKEIIQEQIAEAKKEDSDGGSKVTSKELYTLRRFVKTIPDMKKIDQKSKQKKAE